VENSPGLHSDNQTFLMEGIPAADPLGKLTRSVLDCYHANCDDFSLVNKKEMENTVKYTTMLLYGLANAEQIPAKKLDFYSTKEFFIKHNLRHELELGNEWRWGND